MDPDPNMASENDLPGWFSGRAIQVLFGGLMALLAFYITDTLTQIKGDLRETNQGVQVLMQTREATNARLSSLENVAQRNADRIRELERQVWQSNAARSH